MVSDDLRSGYGLAVVAVFSIALVFLAVFTAILLIVAPFDNPVVAMLIVLAAAVAAAHFWFSQEIDAPSNRRAWSIALICGVISGSLFTAVVAFDLIGRERLARDLNDGGTVAIAAAFVGISTVQALVVRFGFFVTFRHLAGEVKG